MKKRKEIFVFLGLVLILLASGILFLPIPFTRDQGIYAYIGWCWLGEWYPYQYAFGHKGPWLYLVYAIFLKLSKGAMWGVNLADLMSRLASLILLFVFAKMALKWRTALFASFFLFLPLFCVYSSCWWNAQAETFMMPLSILAGIFALASQRQKGTWQSRLSAFFCGAVLSQMLFFKPSGAWLGLGLFLFFLFFAKDDRRSLGFYLLGGLLGAGIWLGYFWYRGIGREFFEEVILFNLVHLQGTRAGAGKLAKTFFRALWLNWQWGLILAVFGFVQLLRKRSEPAYGLILLWLLSSWAELLSQFRFFLYHFISLLAPMSLVLALSFESKAQAQKALCWALAGLWAIFGFRFYWLNQKHYQTLPYLMGKISRAQYYARFQEPPEGEKRDFNFYASWVIGSWIRERTSKNDYVLIYGYEPLINYLSARRSPTRFHSDYFIDFEPKGKMGERLKKRWQKIFLKELEARKPKLVVIVHNDINALEPIDSYHQAMGFSEFWSWLNKNYLPGERIEDFQFFWRRENG